MLNYIWNREHFIYLSLLLEQLIGNSTYIHHFSHDEEID